MIYYGIMHVIDFITYYLIYMVVFHASFLKSIAWKMAACLLGLFLTEAFVVICGETRGAQMVTAMCAIAILFILKNRRQRIWGMLLFPVAMLLSMSVNVLGTYFFSYLLHVPYMDFMDAPALKIWAEMPSLLILTVLWMFQGKRETEEMISLSIPKYLIVLLGAGCLFALVGILQGLMLGDVEAYSMLRLLAIASVIAVVIFVILIYWQALIEKKARQYRQENELYRSYLEKQEMHIHDIIEADQKMRRFRHDIRAHVTALEAEIEMGDMDSLKQYVLRMKEESEKGVAIKYTGIAAVDAVIGEWHQKALEKSIKWTWNGGCLPQRVEHTFELCVIFSNLLSNAVEAAAKVTGDKEIYVYCGAIQENVIIRISNTCDQDTTVDIPSKTTKADVKNHGFGLKNVQAVVEEVNGSMDRKVGNGHYTVEVIL